MVHADTVFFVNSYWTENFTQNFTLETPRADSLFEDNTHASAPYTNTSMMSVLYNVYFGLSRVHSNFNLRTESVVAPVRKCYYSPNLLVGIVSGCYGGA